LANFRKGTTRSFKEEMIKLRESTEQVELRSTSAGGFYSSIREGSDGWMCGKKNIAARLNPEAL